MVTNVVFFTHGNISGRECRGESAVREGAR